MKLTAYWSWDARIVGRGVTEEQDEHLTVMEGLTIPTRVSLMFPSDKAFDRATPQMKQKMRRPDGDIDGYPIPVYAASRIQVDIRMEVEE